MKSVIAKRVFVLSSTEEVKEFVGCVERLDFPVMISREGYTFQVDGSSIIGVMSLIGTRVVIDYDGESEELNSLIDKFCIESKAS